MKKTCSVVLCAVFIAGLFGCGQSDLPQNAKNWLGRYEKMGNESVEIAKRAKALDMKDEAAIKAHNEAGMAFIEQWQTLINDGQKIGDSLSPQMKKRFYEETDKIKNRIEDEREKIKSGQ